MADSVTGKKISLSHALRIAGTHRRRTLKKLHIAMAGMDAQFMNENFTDGIQLNYVGERIVQGRNK